MINQKIKSFISFLTAFAVLAVCFVPAYSASETADFYTNEYTVLRAFNIVDEITSDEDVYFNENITRGEFCKYVTRLFNVDAESYTAKNYCYTDVDRSDKNSGYIYYLKDMGAVNGSSGMTFSPDENITLEQACTIILKLANLNASVIGGDFVSAYYAKALQLNIAESDMKGDEALTKNNMIKIFFNLLDTDVPTLSGITEKNGNKSYLYDKDTFSYVYFDVDSYEGVLTGYSNSMLSENVSLGGGQIMIDKNKYKCNIKNLYEYFGMYVKYYVNSSDEVIALIPEENKVTTVWSDDIDRYENGRLYYDENGKEKHVSIYSKADVIYNGIAYPDYQKSDLEFKNGDGFIKFIDNDSDGTYEIIIIEEYNSYVVDKVSADKKLIYAKYPENAAFEIPYDEDITVFRNDGMEMSLGAVLGMSVISVYKDKNNEKCKIVVSNDYVQGTLTEIDDDEYIIVSNSGEEKRLKADKCFADNMKKISLGYNARFLIGANGRICGTANDYDENLGYGYLFKAAQKDEKKDEVYVKILTAAGEIKKYELSENIKVDGEKFDRLREVYNVLTDSDASGDRYTKAQIIRYKVNADDKINFIDTNEDGRYENYETSLHTESFSNVAFRPGKYIINRKAVIDNFAVCFFVPQVASGYSKSFIEDIDEDDLFVTYKINDYWQSETITADVAIIDEDACLSDCVAIKYDFYPNDNVGGDLGFKVGVSPEYAMVDRVGVTLDKNGDTVPAIYMINDRLIEKKECISEGCTQKYKYDENGTKTTEVTGLKRGDVIKFYSDRNGVIRYTEVLYDIERGDNARFKISNSSKDGVSCAVVYSAGKRGMRVMGSVLSGAPKLDIANADLTMDTSILTAIPLPEVNCKFIVYDSANDEIKHANELDLYGFKDTPNHPSIVFINESYTVPAAIFIIN